MWVVETIREKKKEDFFSVLVEAIRTSVKGSSPSPPEIIS